MFRKDMRRLCRAICPPKSSEFELSKTAGFNVNSHFWVAKVLTPLSFSNGWCSWVAYISLMMAGLLKINKFSHGYGMGRWLACRFPREYMAMAFG
jgi:hypothetical protein